MNRTVVLQPATRTPPNTSRNKSSNTQRTENKTTDVIIHQHSRKLLKMDILMSETCWAHNKWNKIASDIKLVFHSSTSVLHCRYLGCCRTKLKLAVRLPSTRIGNWNAFWPKGTGNLFYKALHCDPKKTEPARWIISTKISSRLRKNYIAVNPQYTHTHTHTHIQVKDIWNKMKKRLLTSLFK